VFFKQSGNTKASRLDYEIAGQQYLQKQLEINAEYKQLLNRYLILKDVITYYKNEALPLVDEQIKASNLAYMLGNIDYVQFIQNMDAAIRIKNEFLSQQYLFFELSAQLNYITGQ
jgi:cobalt-zinc-cadmium resistance protein CzcA